MKCKWRACSVEFEPKGKKLFCGPKCKNKHMVQRRREKVKLLAINYKGNQCFDCKLSFVEYNVYEFHHLDPNQKDFGFSDGLTRGWAKIQEELDKCVMLCCLCHRKRHFSELDPVFNG